MPSLSCFSEVVLVKKRVPDRWKHIVGGLENDRSSPGIFLMITERVFQRPE